MAMAASGSRQTYFINKLEGNVDAAGAGPNTSGLTWTIREFFRDDLIRMVNGDVRNQSSRAATTLAHAMFMAQNPSRITPVADPQVPAGETLCAAIDGIFEGDQQINVSLISRDGRLLRLIVNLDVEQNRGAQQQSFRCYIALAELLRLREIYVPGNALRIYFEKAAVGNQPTGNLTDFMLGLLESGTASDFTIACGSSEFKVHQAVLAARSPVFSAMFGADGMLEAETQRVEVPDVDPDVMKSLIEWMYTSQAPSDFDKRCALIPPADKYQLLELKEACFGGIVEHLGLEHVGTIATLAVKYSPPEPIRKQVLAFIRKNFNAISKIPELKEPMMECFDQLFEH